VPKLHGHWQQAFPELKEFAKFLALIARAGLGEFEPGMERWRAVQADTNEPQDDPLLEERLNSIFDLSQKMGWISARDVKRHASDRRRLFGEDVTSEDIKRYFQILISRGLGSVATVASTEKWCLNPEDGEE